MKNGLPMATELIRSKVVLLGDGGVGKTSLVRRFVVDNYSDEYITTVGTKVSKRSLNVGHPAAEVEMSMQIWDVLGQKGYSGVQETAMKGAQGVLMVYDATNDESRRALEDYWVPAVWRLAGRVPMIIAGNKADLVDDRVWAEDYLYFLREKYTCPGVLTSAKTGEHVEVAFKSLGEQILKAAGHGARRVAMVTPPQEPVDRLIRVTDKVMTDFCYHMGGVETGMPIVKRQLGLAGLDVRAPSTEAIRDLIERLAVVERDFKGPDEITANRARRIGWLDGPE
ncbi:MAG TPA: GTP-binding protein [Thermoplasmata archaeon]|nr:GTP-binding protein [Thermoplasmata archaeon]